MTRILVTGASGRLGRAAVERFAAAGFEVLAASRTARPSDGGAVRWVVADLTTGAGIAEAVDGVDAIVHLASAPYQGKYTGRVELEGTARLLRAAGDRHLIYVSIVGVDRVPWGYYKTKLQAEELVAGSSVPYTILRATQFHEFVSQGLGLVAKLGIRVIDPGMKAQPVDVRDVAGELVELVRRGPACGIVEYGGPEILDPVKAFEEWLRAHGRRGRILRVRLPGAFGRAARAGALTTRAQPAGKITWSEYLSGH